MRGHACNSKWEVTSRQVNRLGVCVTGVSPYASMPPLAFVAAHPGLAAPTSAVAAPVAHATDPVWFHHLQQPAPQALAHPAAPAPAWGLGSLPPGLSNTPPTVPHQLTSSLLLPATPCG